MKKNMFKSALLATLFAVGITSTFTACDDDEEVKGIEFGTPAFTATTLKAGADVADGKITIPYERALGSEEYTVKVAVSGAAAAGITVADKSVTLDEGKGSIEIAVSGKPTTAGDVTFTISGIKELAKTTATATVAVADPVLAFGTPTFTATNLQAKAIIEGGKITIPYTYAKGTEQYILSVAATGTASAGINAVTNVEKTLTSGNGNIELEITGTPTKAGDVTFTISGITGLTTTTINATVEIADAYAWYEKGKATGNFELKKAADLKEFANLVNGTDKENSGQTASLSFEGQTVKIADAVTEIDLNSEDWTPIGTSTLSSFKGTFDGNGKEIKNLKIDKATEYNQALFGNITDATLKNIVVSGNIKASTGGGIVGQINGSATCYIIACINKVNLQLGVAGGGITNGGGTRTYIMACENYGRIEGTVASATIGGIISTGYETYLTACVNHANIGGSSTSTAGGIAGRITREAAGFNACLSEGDVTANSFKTGIGAVDKVIEYSENYFVSTVSGLKAVRCTNFENSPAGTDQGTSTYAEINGKVADLNAAIAAWNTAHSTATCNYSYQASTGDKLPILVPAAK